MSTLVQVILSGTVPGILSDGQFMPAYSGKSLFQLCIERNISFAKRQLVVGHNEYYVHARDYFKSTGNKTYLSIIEEDRLTNVFSVAFAAFSAGVEEILLITPSGYLIKEEGAYKNAVEKMVLIAKEGRIGVLPFHSEQVVNNMPFMICEEERIKSFEVQTDDKQPEDLLKNKKHFIYSGILCCKAGVYLQELKIWAPDIYELAKNAWETRVAQYVAIDTSNLKTPQATIESVLLTASDKIKVVAGTNIKLQVPNTDKLTTDSSHPHSEIKSNKGPKILGLAL